MEVGDPATGEPMGDTATNLRSAVAGETYEFTAMYPGSPRPPGTRATRRSPTGWPRWPAPRRPTPVASRKRWTGWPRRPPTRCPPASCPRADLVTVHRAYCRPAGRPARGDDPRAGGPTGAPRRHHGAGVRGRPDPDLPGPGDGLRRGPDEPSDVQHELDAYGRYLPTSHSLTATVFIEGDDVRTVKDQLQSLTGIQHRVRPEIGRSRGPTGSPPSRGRDRRPRRRNVHRHPGRPFRPLHPRRRPARRVRDRGSVTLAVEHPEYSAAVDLDGDLGSG